MATWPTITDDDGSNTTGTIANNANIWNPIRDYINNGMTSVAHSSGNFTASSGSWTVDVGDQIAFAYAEIGKFMVVTFDLNTTSVSATPTDLRITIPNARTAARSMTGGMFAYNENGTAGTGLSAVNGTTIFLYKSLATPTWSTLSNLTRVQGTIIFEIA